MKMKWERVSGKDGPKRWAKACGLVQLYVQHYPMETVVGMRFKWQMCVNGSAVLTGTSHSERSAKTACVRASKRVLVSALQLMAGNDITKWFFK